jgi:hypothetical protein
MENVSRAFRYALLLTPAQDAAIQRQERQLRFAWNRMVNWQRCTLRDWKYGRRTQLLSEINAIQSGKSLVGQKVIKARELAQKENISVEEAARRNSRQVSVRKQKYGRRRLGVELAQERLMAEAEHFYGGSRCLLYGLIQKFQKSCENWLKLRGTAQKPQYKKEQDNVALQRQITKSSACSVGPETPQGIIPCDLSTMLGQAGTHCRVIWHRKLPNESTVKQLAIAGRPGKRFLVVFFTCPRHAVLKPFAPSQSRAGIATGYSCALTVVSDTYVENREARREALAHDITLDQKLSDDPQSPDGKAMAGALGNLEQYIFSQTGALELQPPLARDRHFLKRLRRLQRRMYRQKRAANPDCFNPDGTWKKGKRARNVTNNLVETHQQVQRLNERQADVRRDYYHLAAYQLLRKHGHVSLSDWTPPVLKKEKKPAAKGQGRKRRSMNRKALDHAISSFKGILQDKASLSASPRTVVICETDSRTCATCKAKTGPEKPDHKTWICSACGTENSRKANTAENAISAAKAAMTFGGK